MIDLPQGFRRGVHRNGVLRFDVAHPADAPEGLVRFCDPGAIAADQPIDAVGQRRQTRRPLGGAVPGRAHQVVGNEILCEAPAGQPGDGCAGQVAAEQQHIAGGRVPVQGEMSVPAAQALQPVNHRIEAGVLAAGDQAVGRAALQFDVGDHPHYAQRQAPGVEVVTVVLGHGVRGAVGQHHPEAGHQRGQAGQAVGTVDQPAREGAAEGLLRVIPVNIQRQAALGKRLAQPTQTGSGADPGASARLVHRLDAGEMRERHVVFIAERERRVGVPAAHHDDVESGHGVGGRG